MRSPASFLPISAVFVALTLINAGCRTDSWNPTEGLEDTPTTVRADRRPAAISSGAPVSHVELLPVLTELAGASALREIALDREIRSELQRRGLEVSASDIDTERARLEAAIGGDEIGQELTRSVFASRGLGPTRLAALLERNAGLRKLIETPDSPGEEALRVAYSVRHGAKRRVRVAVFASSSTAANALRDIRAAAATSGVIAAFAEVAMERSIDPSAPVGGLLGEVSTADPGLPAALRRLVTQAEAGSLGDIVAVDSGFALVLVERDIPPDGTAFESVRDELALEVRERAARLAMEQLAEDLIRRAQVSPLEPGLRWSWDQARP